MARIVRDPSDDSRVQCFVDRGTNASIDPGDEFLVCRQLTAGDQPLKRVLTGTLIISAVQRSSAFGTFTEGLPGRGRPRLKLGPVAAGDLLLPRLVLPATLLFTPGTATLAVEANGLLASAAAAIGRYAPTKAVVTAYAVAKVDGLTGSSLSLQQAECVCRQLKALSSAIGPGMLLPVGGGNPPADESPRPGNDQTPDPYVEIVIWE